MSAVKVHRIDKGVNDLNLSAVVGVGADAHRIATIGAWSFMVPENNQEPMIRDLDAAERLEFAQPRQIRELIERIWPENKRPINRRTVRRWTAGKGAQREEEVSEYWLTEAQLLKVCARARTQPAEAVLDDMIRVYMTVRRGLLLEVTSGAADRLLKLETENRSLRAGALAATILGPLAKSQVLHRIRVIAELETGIPWRRGREKLAPELKSLRTKIDRDLRTMLRWPMNLAWANYPIAEAPLLFNHIDSYEHRAARVASARARGSQTKLPGT